jgi:hypothetical protein
MGHSLFVAWSGKHCLICFCLLDIVISCLGLWDTARCHVHKHSKIMLFSRHCTMSSRPSHEITMSNRQKHLEQCLSNQATNEKCPTDKFPLPLLGCQPLIELGLLLLIELGLLLHKEEYEQDILHSHVIYHCYIHYRVSIFMMVTCIVLT